MFKPLAFGLALLAAPAAAQDLASTNVTVVDTRTGVLTPHRTVLIHERRIVSVSGDAAPSGAATVRGDGKFLITGLWDMVTHLSWARASALPVLVASGVTAVRQPSSAPS